MAYIYPEHSVGDTVYFYNEEQDAVIRGVVKRVTAETAEPTGKWLMQYVVRNKWAAHDERQDFTLDAEQLHSHPRDAFPEPPPDAAPAEAMPTTPLSVMA